jgi:hypothetical protein
VNATLPAVVNGTLPAANLTAPQAPFQNNTAFTRTVLSTEVTDVTTTISLADSVVTSVLRVTSTHTVVVHFTTGSGGVAIPVSTALPGATPIDPNSNNAMPSPNGGDSSEPTTTVVITGTITDTLTMTRTRQVQTVNPQKGFDGGDDESPTTTTVAVTITQTTTVQPAGTAAAAAPMKNNNNNNNVASGCGGAGGVAAAAAAVAPSVVTVTEKATVTRVRCYSWDSEDANTHLK